MAQVPLSKLLVPWVPSPSQNHQKHYNNVVEGGNSVTYSALLITFLIKSDDGLGIEGCLKG